MTMLGAPMRDYVLRVSDGAAIDRPHDLMPNYPVVGDAICSWVTSWYPDVTISGGWRRADWMECQPRGFMIPRHSATGDVIEFGLGWRNMDGKICSDTIQRWYGWLNYGTDRALVLKGRYPTLEAAAVQAEVVVDLVRLGSINPDMSFDMTEIDPTYECDDE